MHKTAVDGYYNVMMATMGGSTNARDAQIGPGGRPPRVAVAAVLLMAVAAAAAPTARALSLGDAVVTTRLDAPLVAVIRVVGATPDELARLRVEIPAADVFTRYGLDRPAFLAGATVELRRAADGSPVLELRTVGAVDDPFITVLLAADWGDGSLLREFNLAIDRPGYAAEALAPVEVRLPALVAVGADAPAPRAATALPVDGSGPPRDDSAPSVAVVVGAAAPDARIDTPAPRIGPQTITVGRGATLYQIAVEVARRTGLSVDRVAVGIYRANPQAFGATMNDLRAGAVLRIPDAAALAGLSSDMVATEMARTVADWRRRGGTSVEIGSTGGRVRLVAASGVAVGDTAAPARTEPAPPTAPEQQAAADRVVELERLLSEERQRLEVSQTELARLQERAAAEAARAAQRTAAAAAEGASETRFAWLFAAALLVIATLVYLLFGARRGVRIAQRETASANRALAAAVSAPVVASVAASAAAAAPRRDATGAGTVPTALRETEPSRGSTDTVADIPDVLLELSRTAGPVAMDEPDAPVPPRRSRTAAWVFDDEPPLAEEFDNKLDLARAFMDMGTPAAARAELETVLRMGGGEQREAARRLLTAMR